MLLTGTGNDLELQTFKLTDQLSGRMMGVRADMTPQGGPDRCSSAQACRPVRLCYMGTVLRTRADGFGGSRSPYQAGVELYGHRGHESDLEVLMLMLETLQTAGIGACIWIWDMGGISRTGPSGRIGSGARGLLFEALQRKALPEIRQQLAVWALPAPCEQAPLALAELNGGRRYWTRRICVWRRPARPCATRWRC